MIFRNNFIFPDTVHILYLSCNINKLKLIANFLKRADNCDALAVFLKLSSVKPQLILGNRGTRKYMSWSVTVKNKAVSRQCKLTAQKEQVHAKYTFDIFHEHNVISKE